MTRLPRALLLLVLFLSAGTAPAAAGTEDDPEVRDASGDAPPAHDLEAAWFETGRDGVRFTLRIQDAPQPQRDVLYYVAFTLDQRRWLAGIGYDDDGRMHTYLGAPNVGVGGQGVETFANGKLDDARHLPGRPTYLSALIPFDAVDGLGTDAVLEDLSAGVDRVVRERTWMVEDLQNSDESYTVETVGLARFARSAQGGAQAAGVVLGGLAVAGVVVGGAYVYSQRRPVEREPPAGGANADGDDGAAPHEPKPKETPPSAPKRHRLRLDPLDEE